MSGIDKVKHKFKEIEILKVADALGLEYKRKSAKCFMHDDRNPSLAFNTKKNTWKCYACNVGGDQISLVMKFKDQSYLDASKWLADRFNIPIPGDDGYRNWKPAKKTQVKLKRNTTNTNLSMDVEILSWIIDHAELSEIAKDFLFIQRKYKPEIVEELKIGSISYPVKLVNALVKTFGRDRVLKSGIVKQYHSELNLFFQTPCLIFPYTDEEGNVMNIQTRYLGTNQKAHRFQFLPSSPISIFNKPILKNITNDEPLYISEGITDCIALLSSGRKAVAIPSATLLNDADIRLLAPNNLYMYPDNDKPGELLYKNLSEKLDVFGTLVMKLELPKDCKDFSDYYNSKLYSNNVQTQRPK